MEDRSPMLSLGAVPTETTTIVQVETAANEEKEVILHRQNGDVIAWLNACQHYRHIPIDKGEGATMRNGEFVCQNHGAYFEADSGHCTFGPCEGAYLDSVDVAVEDGDVYLTDENYDFVGTGPLETDETDLTSTSNVEF
ncbi:Rieske (2Fe-2S) protein [Halobacteria archaeon AArc-curdl1]|uniref:Rieske (2Fe-2S) protein n=1 Tax=Natronosalvus hydrolyticus TaxID=2979988 RepID=A0AAP2Z520_9EURY|nr:Rieske (2Fe-2S) protein [Halobacteria archaeon AArc-curdl1]